MSGVRSKTLAGHLSLLIDKSAFTRKQVAEKLEISASLLSQQLQGKVSIPLEKIKLIGEMLGLPAAEVDKLTTKPTDVTCEGLLSPDKHREMLQQSFVIQEYARQLRQKNCQLRVPELKIDSDNLSVLINYRTSSGLYMELSLPRELAKIEMNCENLSPVLRGIAEKLIADIAKVAGQKSPGKDPPV